MIKYSKILIVFLTILITLSLSITVFAADDNFDLTAFDSATGTDDVKNIAKTTMGTVLNVIRYGSAGIFIIILTVIGIRYMYSSAGDRADIKKHLMPFAIGALIVFGSSSIIDILVKLSGSITI